MGKSKINEQLNLKNMLKNKRGSTSRAQVEQNPSDMLIFHRKLGHKVAMPGSGQWRMIATEQDPEERCWVCNQDVFSLVFWSRDFGIKSQCELEKTGIDEIAYENQLFEIEKRCENLGIKIDYLANDGNPQLPQQARGHLQIGYPYVYGEFNNWKPQRMYTIEEFCYLVDPVRPDFIKNLKRSK